MTRPEAIVQRLAVASRDSRPRSTLSESRVQPAVWRTDLPASIAVLLVALTLCLGIASRPPRRDSLEFLGRHLQPRVGDLSFGFVHWPTNDYQDVDPRLGLLQTGARSRILPRTSSCAPAEL